MSWGYPPGHPTGTERFSVEYECETCGESTTLGVWHERDTNAWGVEPEDGCECGEPWPDDVLSKGEPLSAEDFEPDRPEDYD